MAGLVEQQSGVQRPLAWLDRLEALVTREFAPSARKIRRLRVRRPGHCQTPLEVYQHISSGTGHDRCRAGLLS